jgi:8-oxo-dGTP diphosphatase
MMPRAAVFVLYRSGQVLMEWREDGVFAPGHWSFPGGRLEQGEEPHQGLNREATEELGVTLLDAAPMEQVVYKKFEILPYLVTRWDGTLPNATLDAGSPLVWHWLDDACENTWPPARAIARAILSEVKQ